MKMDLQTVLLLVALGYILFKPKDATPKKTTADLADIAKLVAAVAALKKALGKTTSTVKALQERIASLHSAGGASGAGSTGPVDEFGAPYGSGGAVDGVGW